MAKHMSMTLNYICEFMFLQFLLTCSVTSYRVSSAKEKKERNITTDICIIICSVQNFSGWRKKRQTIFFLLEFYQKIERRLWIRKVACR